MPSIRGSSQFKAIKGITIYGIQGATGITGATGADLYGPTGSTAEKYITTITLSSDKLITTFLDGTTHGAGGTFYGITGNTIVRFDGKTGSTGDGYIFVGATADERIVEIRKIIGSTGFRAGIGITSDAETITVKIERYDGEYTRHSGSLSQIIGTDLSGNLIGLTAARYGNIEDVVNITKANVYEKTRGAYGVTGSIDYDYSFDQTTIRIHPHIGADNSIDRKSKTKVFAIDLNSSNPNNLTKIIIDPPQSESIGFSLYVRGGKMPATYSVPIFSCPGGSVVFPFNQEPCFRNNAEVLIHFISANNTWYGYVFKSTGSALCNINSGYSSFAVRTKLDFYQGVTGACCKSNGDCEIVAEGLCDGFFAGIGTTCGVTGTTSVCTENLGSCCVKNTIDGKVSTYCIENISSSNCLALSNEVVETVFSGFGKTCEDVNCEDCFNELGACCDGQGGCTQQTKIDCIAKGNSFLGKGIRCYTDNKTPSCSSGTGACCNPNGTCTNSTAETCIDAGGKYFGNGTTCAGVTCAASLSCAGFLNFAIKPGDLLAGGIVVGVYNPKTAKLLGASHAFSRNGATGSFLYGGETMAGYYQSEFDFVGYGFTGDSCASIINQENSDSYIIVASLYPASVDENGNAVDPTQTNSYQDGFVWYGEGIAWGPMLHPTKYSYQEFTFLNKKYESLYLSYGEGYYGITGENSDNLKESTFQSCYSTRVNGVDPVARLFTRNVKTLNGLWNRSWGIYNTIRMVCADNADYMKLSNAPYFYTGDFDSGTEMNSVRALKLFSNSTGITGSSDWYIPSHDELAFIAANCVTDSTNPYAGFNLNTELLLKGGVPFYDWHWSSTGSFDTTSETEGVYVSGKPEHGTVAWAIYFDPNGTPSDFMVKKESRQTKLKVRPIRAIRCDGSVPASSTEQYKLWKVPNLLRNRS